MQSLGDLLAAVPAIQAMERERVSRYVGTLLLRVKAGKRAERFARFERSARDGLAYSRTVGKRMTKHQGDGGARLEFQMRRIIN